MVRLNLRFAAILLALILITVLSSTGSAAGVSGSDQVVMWLRDDWAEANNAKNYALWVDPATPKPANGAAADSYGYLGAWVGDGTKFIQVGYKIAPDGVRWFAWSNGPGIVCDRGRPEWNNWGCIGDLGDYASLDQFHQIQLDTNLNGTWQAFVYDTQGRGVQVAHRFLGSNVLVSLYTSSEESYTDQPSDPFIMVRYYHYHPKYWKAGVGWTDWPCSIQACQPAHLNHLQQDQCPPAWPYAAVINIGGDPRSWFAGTGGNTCNPQGPIF